MSDDSNDTKTIETFILTTLTEEFGIAEQNLTPDASLKSLNIDSLGGVELSLKIKKKYGVTFIAGEISVDFTVADITALVEQKLAEPESGAA
jgi:acyl carrier protein